MKKQFGNTRLVLEDQKDLNLITLKIYDVIMMCMC
jgi:hypothetical protein